ncbi:MAG: sulfatase-like hydrolase/transferase [Verrucomicrobiota bacterium]
MAHIIFRRLQFVMGTMALAILAVPQLPAAGAQPKPNLLFILTDQQHANMLSCAGNPWLKTPAMDSLAANGIRFQRAYSVNPVCVPARVGMFTGHTPSRFGMQSNKEMQETKIPAPIQAQTMGCLLRDAGYETAYGGKTHLPGNVEKYGFTVLTRDQRDELATTCADFLKKKHDKPFLLVASLINPHDICYMAINAFAASQARKKTGPAGPHQQCLAEALQKPAGISEEEFFSRLCPPAPANLEPQLGAPEAIGDASYLGFRGYAFTNWTEKDWRLHRWAYARLTERVDREIEVILQALRSTGLETNTAVIFTSDHGDHDGSHRLEHKSTFYEEAANVPFIISQKGVTRANVVDREHLIAAHLDLIPTLCDYAGVAAPDGLKGRSLRALAENGSVKEWRPYVVSETHFGRMVCSGRYKYCVYDRGEHREQLVDLQQDPGEMKNLAGQPEFQAVLTQHRKYLQEWVVSNQDSLAAPYLVK